MKSERAGAGRRLLWAGLGLSSLALAAWLATLALFAHAMTTQGSPPRVARWDGPEEDDNLPAQVFLLEDEAWLVRSARLDDVPHTDEGPRRDHRMVIVRVALERGVAETGWDLHPILEGRRTAVRGVARRDDGGVSLILAEHGAGMRAVSLLPDRRVEDHGVASEDASVGAIGVAWDAGVLRCALGDGRALRWGGGPPAVEIMQDVPALSWRTRDAWLAAARWTDAGWDVLVWEAASGWRWTRSGSEGAQPQSAARYGALSSAPPPFADRVPVGPPGLGAPPNPAVHERSRVGSMLRATSEPGQWEPADASGGFWDWCLPRDTRWVCVTHQPWVGGTRIFDGQGHDSASEVHGRFSPADPVIVPASAGGVWVLDVSNVSLDGRIYYRLNDDLTRADPMTWGERYERARPSSRREAGEWQATSGPSAMLFFGDERTDRVQLFLQTAALPVELLAFPVTLALLLMLLAAIRPGRSGVGVLLIVLFTPQVLLVVAMASSYLHILQFV